MRLGIYTSVFLLVACGGDATGPDGGQLSGTYQIAGTGTPVAGVGPWTFRVVSQDADRIILDWTAGPIRGTLPVRDTASWNVSAYRLDFHNGGPTYIVRITGSSCTGQTFFAFGNSPAWTTCTISRP
jgi:hypothetical protein